MAIKIALEEQGIDPDRFSIVWVSSAEAPRFAQLVTDFVSKIRELGPNPIKNLQKQTA